MFEINSSKVEQKKTVPTASAEAPRYVCPDCKSMLADLKCATCKVQFTKEDGFPILLSKDTRFQSGGWIGAVYDEIYSNRSNVWEDQGRTPEFIGYFSNLLAGLSSGTLLEVGCGEGILLSALHAERKVAVDLSVQALRIARQRTPAEFSVALAERLPFQDGVFDLIVSVGVMEHFLDDREATREIRRVLACGGNYVALIHVNLTRRQQIQQKVHEYVYPNVRPWALVKWISSKIIRPVKQPIQRRYTADAARKCLEQCGLKVKRIISLDTDAHAALIGPHVLIYVASK